MGFHQLFDKRFVLLKLRVDLLHHHLRALQVKLDVYFLNCDTSGHSRFFRHRRQLALRCVYAKTLGPARLRRRKPTLQSGISNFHSRFLQALPCFRFLSFRLRITLRYELVES